jgi:exodeoxyribonuclease VII small subunit
MDTIANNPETANESDGPTFEEALRQLEQIVDDLERGEPGLTEALSKYEQGVRLLSRCQAELDRAARSVALLTGVDESGNPVTAAFDATATATTESEEPSPATKATPKPRKRSTPPPNRDEPFIPF